MVSEAEENVEKDAPICWEVRLSDRAPWKRWVVLAVALGVGLYGGARSPLLGLVGFGIVMSATAEFWSPIRYRLTAGGAQSRAGWSLSSLEWGEVKRVVVGPDALKLSPLAHPTKWGVFRGVALRFREADREGILDYIRRRVGDDVRFVEATAD